MAIYSSTSSEMDSNDDVLPWLDRLKLFADVTDDVDDEADDEYTVLAGFAKGYNGIDGDGGEAIYSTCSRGACVSSVASAIESRRCGL